MLVLLQAASHLLRRAEGLIIFIFLFDKHLAVNRRRTTHSWHPNIETLYVKGPNHFVLVIKGYVSEYGYKNFWYFHWWNMNSGWLKFHITLIFTTVQLSKHLCRRRQLGNQKSFKWEAPFVYFHCMYNLLEIVDLNVWSKTFISSLNYMLLWLTNALCITEKTFNHASRSSFKMSVPTGLFLQ